MVPPLEGFWWQDGVSGIDYARKEDFKWISVIRLPNFVTREDFDWAVRKATAKKKQDFSKLSDRSVETCEAYRRGRACGSNVIKLRISILSHQQIFDIFVDEIFTFLHSKKTD